MQNKVKKVIVLSFFVSISVILSFIEMSFFSFNIQGVKLGLANSIIVTPLYIYTFIESLIISVSRVFIVGFSFSRFTGIIYSLFGAIFSLIFMQIFKSLDKFSVIGISIIGATVHNITQLLIAYFLINNLKVFYYLPLILISGIFTGFIVGVISNELIKRLEGINEK